VVFRRGFKSQCERRAVEFRRDQKCAEFDPLSAKTLANSLDVAVWSTNEVEGLSLDHLKVLNDPDDDSWSACTLRISNRNLILIKDIQSEGRKNSVIMHELSHIILGHELAEAMTSEDGSLVPASFDQEQEDEADWLGGALLLPRAALVKVLYDNRTTRWVCDEYGVSAEMLRWRLRMTGVEFQLKRSLKR
jgi:Zn-dependent peptidase ImmA (M78 family)